MITNALFLRILEKTKERLNSLEYFYTIRKEIKAFTRNGKLGYKNIIMIILNYMKRTIQMELDDFFCEVIESDGTVTKQAFSEARQKILPIAFKILIEDQIETIYAEKDLKTYRGYIVIADDGSTLELQNTEELRNHYGYAENKAGKYARAKTSCFYDVENNIILDAILEKYNFPERELAKMHFENIKKYNIQNMLMLYDRGYGSKEFIAMHIAEGKKFLMRVQKSFIKEVENAKEDDQEITFWYLLKRYRIRVFRFLLDSGEEEVLVSNIFDKDFVVEDAKALYFKRWNIEVKYNEMKHRLQIENFSAIKPLSVEQDFYATIFLQNMASLAKMGADEEISERNKDEELKYEYQANVNILVGKLKTRMILMLLEKDSNKRIEMYEKIIAEIVKNSVPIRPGRQFERKFKCSRDRYPMNARKSL